jgi:RNA polymerase sigma-70 factor (ECF subfamily)
MTSNVSFTDFYQAHVGYALNRARGLGVEDAGVDDVVQRVFWVAFRRFDEFRPQHAKGSAKAWVLAILRRVVSEHRRSARRSGRILESRHADPEWVADSRRPGPHDDLVRTQAARLVRRLVGELEEDKRVVFVLAELEDLTVSEIACALGVNVNTVASRLRAARRDFERAAARYRLQESAEAHAPRRSA